MARTACGENQSRPQMMPVHGAAGVCRLHIQKPLFVRGTPPRLTWFPIPWYGRAYTGRIELEAETRPRR